MGDRHNESFEGFSPSVQADMLQTIKLVLKSSSFNEAARHVFDACCRGTGATAGYVALLSADGAGNEVLFLETGGAHSSVDPSMPMPIRGLRAEAYSRACVVYENDFMNSQWACFLPKGHIAVRNVVFAPLVIGGKTVGLIGLANKPADFTEIDALLVDTYGDMAAVVLQQSRAQEALVEANRRLTEAKSIADEANQAKSRFLADMSHEIRAPMNAIIGFTDLLLQENLTPDQRRFVEIVKARGQDLLQLINDILDFAKIEADRVEFRQEPFSLQHMLKETCDTFCVAADKKGVMLDVLQSPDLPDELIGDNLRVRQILTNLVGNAVKFTENGFVALHALPSSLPFFISFKVQDSGDGIPDDVLQRLFDPFTQGSQTRTNLHAGFGLGLAISSKLTSRMGGRIWVESNRGKGTVFYVELPLLPRPANNILPKLA